MLLRSMARTNLLSMKLQIWKKMQAGFAVIPQTAKVIATVNGMSSIFMPTDNGYSQP